MLALAVAGRGRAHEGAKARSSKLEGGEEEEEERARPRAETRRFRGGIGGVASLSFSDASRFRGESLRPQRAPRFPSMGVLTPDLPASCLASRACLASAR